MNSPKFSLVRWLESHPKLKNNRLVLWVTSHWELVTYVIFGGLTTVVDWTVRFILYGVFPESQIYVHLADVIAWVAAVLFAFVTNKLFVFESKTKKPLRVLSELGTFAGGRVLSLGVQEALMFVFTGLIGWNPVIVTIPVSILVVIINYFLTKFVFRKKTDGQ